MSYLVEHAKLSQVIGGKTILIRLANKDVA